MYSSIEKGMGDIYMSWTRAMFKLHVCFWEIIQWVADAVLYKGNVQTACVLLQKNSMNCWCSPEQEQFKPHAYRCKLHELLMPWRRAQWRLIWNMHIYSNSTCNTTWNSHPQTKQVYELVSCIKAPISIYHSSCEMISIPPQTNFLCMSSNSTWTSCVLSAYYVVQC